MTPDKAFKIANITDKTTEIVFEIPEVEILNDGEGFSKFDTGNMIGTTVEEGMPELPIYSSLFQMTPIKVIKEVFEVNFFSIVSLTQKLLKIFSKGSYGKIINISSNAAKLSSAGRSGYAPSKSALISFTEVLSKELGNYKICVNAIAPGLVNTDMMKETPENIVNEALKNTPLKKAAEPEEVAKTALFLASDLSNHVSGETIYITGGM